MITIHNGQMEEELEKVENESVDLLLTDPPYNISEKGANPVWLDPVTGENKNKIHNQQFSSSFEDDWDAISHEDFLKQLELWSSLWFQKLRKGGSFAVFISDKYISHLWHIMEQSGFEPKRIITWKKPAAVPFNRNVNPVSGCEYILWGIKPKGSRTFNSATESGSIIDRYTIADKASSIAYRIIKDQIHNQDLDSIFSQIKQETEKMISSRKQEDNKILTVVPNTVTFSGGIKNKIHPTQKPVELLEYFVELLTNPGDTVLDTFAGSGSTGIACKNRNRHAVLIERDTAMYQEMSKGNFLNPDLFEE